MQNVWDQKFFFDNEVNLSNCRYSQAELAYKKLIEYEDWFKKPKKDISGYLYDLVWMVGSGKTLAIPLMPFAYNHVVRKIHGISSPRVKNLLVLTKEKSLRDQLYDNIGNELSDRKICTVKPRIKKITNGKFFTNLDNIDDFDICVCCIQQLWDKVGGKNNMTEILSRFQMTAIDEPHFGPEQVNEIVKNAPHLVFGFTGTPFDSDGIPIKNQVVFSFYDYNQANKKDHSLKFIPDLLQDYLHVIGIKNADMQEGDIKYQTSDANHKGYKYGLPPATSVAETVIEHLDACDKIGKQQIEQKIIAPHRESYSDKISSEMRFYPAHGIICVSDRRQAKTLQEDINKLLDNDRNRFPVNEGWIASIAMSSDIDCNIDKKIKIEPLDANHPWNFAQHNNGSFYVKKGKKEKFGSRILILVGMGKEGLDNPLCTTLGIACSKSSQQELPQRIGRTIRSAHKVDKNGKLILPPKILDMPKIITHETYYEKELYEFSHNFLLDMKQYISEMTDMDQLIAGQIPVDIDPIDSESLSDQERIQIADLLCKELKINGSIDPSFVDKIVVSFANNSERKANKIKNWSDLVEHDPKEACSRLSLREKLSSIPAVLREEQNRNINDEKLLDWMKQHKPHGISDADLDSRAKDRVSLSVWKTLYDLHFDKFKLPPSSYVTDIECIRQDLRSDIMKDLQFADRNNSWGIFIDDIKRSNILKKVSIYVNAAIKQIIGTSISVEKGGEFDKPQYHVIFSRPHVNKNIKGFVMRILAKDKLIGYLDNLIDREENQ
jgi:superfamily II DNA or RNA helicase